MNPQGDTLPTPHLVRSTEEERQRQIRRVRDFQMRNSGEAPEMVRRLQAAATGGGNIFEVLVDAVRVLSLGQITETLFEVGGQYRRSM
jgi:methylmalonyl-CoA mutase